MTNRTKRLLEPVGKRRFADRTPGPFGEVWSVVDEAGSLVQLDFEGGRSAPENEARLCEAWQSAGQELRFDAARVEHVVLELAAYFSGSTKVFELEVAPSGTPFQLAVWRALLDIPYGVTENYGQLAQRLDRPGAARAVGRANGTNPVSLVIPCHRVIGADGSLTGYGGGMDRKRGLLELEGLAQDPWNRGLGEGAVRAEQV